MLDVLVLPGEIESGFRSGCAFDPVIIDGEKAWRLNQTSGRFEAVSPNKVRCPKGDGAPPSCPCTAGQAARKVPIQYGYFAGRPLVEAAGCPRVLERSAVEAEYVRDLVELLTSGRLPIEFKGHRVTGMYPVTVLTLLFHVPGHSPCLYGVDDRIWEEDPIGAFGIERAVTYTWLRIEELVVAAGTDLPTTCQPDDEGITHVDLWAG